MSANLGMCECSELKCGRQHNGFHWNVPDRGRLKGVFGQCQGSAVRLVTVRTKASVIWPAGQEYTLKLCEPCAQFHEAKAGAR